MCHIENDSIRPKKHQNYLRTFCQSRLQRIKQFCISLGTSLALITWLFEKLTLIIKFAVFSAGDVLAKQIINIFIFAVVAIPYAVPDQLSKLYNYSVFITYPTALPFLPHMKSQHLLSCLEHLPSLTVEKMQFILNGKTVCRSALVRIDYLLTASLQEITHSVFWLPIFYIYSEFVDIIYAINK